MCVGVPVQRIGESAQWKDKTRRPLSILIIHAADDSRKVAESTARKCTIFTIR